MSTPSSPGLHPVLRGYPGIVLELRRDGTVVESNGALERALERGVTGRPLGAGLDEPSRRKLETILARGPDAVGGPSTPWELVL